MCVYIISFWNQDYMAFMISKETENVQSSAEIENAFRAISAQVILLWIKISDDSICQVEIFWAIKTLKITTEHKKYQENAVIVMCHIYFFL